SLGSKPIDWRVWLLFFTVSAPIHQRFCCGLGVSFLSFLFFKDLGLIITIAIEFCQTITEDMVSCSPREIYINGILWNVSKHHPKEVPQQALLSFNNRGVVLNLRFISWQTFHEPRIMDFKLNI